MAQAAEIGSSNDTSNATRKWASHYLWSSREVPSHASHGHTSQVIMEITRVTCLRSICFYFHLCSFYIYISKGFSQIYSYHGCGGLRWNVPYHRQRANTCRLRPVETIAVTGMYTRYKDISRVQFSHLFSPNLQGREKDLLRRKAQRYCWRRLLRYIFQGFMQGRYLVFGSRWLCVEIDDMRLHAGGNSFSKHIVKSLLGPVGSGRLCLDYQFWPGVCRAQQCEANAQKILVLKVPCSCIAGKSRSQPFLGTSGWDHSFSIPGYVISSLECNICSAISSYFHIFLFVHYT